MGLVNIYPHMTTSIISISTSIIYEYQLLFINFRTAFIIYELYDNFYYYDNFMTTSIIYDMLTTSSIIFVL